MRLIAWAEKASTLRVAAALGVIVALVKLPILFSSLGEQDQGRLLMDAIVYAHDGPDTLRRYGLYTSPIWTFFFSVISKSTDVKDVVLASNIGGWLCGGLISALTFSLLDKLGAARPWALAAGIVVALVPGTFYLSLYGYPSQYALPLLLGAALCFAMSHRTTGYRSFTWIAAAAVFFVLLALVKIDFTIAGTLLLSVAIASKRLIDIRTLLLLLLPVAATSAALIVTAVLLDGEPLGDFLRRVNTIYPWQSGELLASPGSTILYACGFATSVLLLAGFAWSAVRRKTRAWALRDAAAWMIAVLPIWLFWLARPPISSRHAVPGVLATVIFAALAASRATSKRRVAVVWTAAIVALNWPFGRPAVDFNYKPSGNLVATLGVNRRAFEVADGIAADIARAREPAKVIIGRQNASVLGGIDLTPFIEIEMASTASRVKAVRTGWELLFTYPDGRQSVLVPYATVESARKFRIPGARFYAPYGDDVSQLQEAMLPIVRFSPNERYGGRP